MSPDVLLECPRTSFRDVLRVNVTERVWIFPLPVCPPPSPSSDDVIYEQPLIMEIIC